MPDQSNWLLLKDFKPKNGERVIVWAPVQDSDDYIYQAEFAYWDHSTGRFHQVLYDYVKYFNNFDIEYWQHEPTIPYSL